MPEKKTIRRAQRDKAQGKAPTTQAGEFVREEMEHIRKGKHGARSTKQAIAIGLSKARRAGVPLPPPREGTTSEKTRRSAESAYRKGQAHEPVSAKRSEAREKALKREPRTAASHASLSRQARSVAKKRAAKQAPSSSRTSPVSSTRASSKTQPTAKSRAAKQHPSARKPAARKKTQKSSRAK